MTKKKKVMDWGTFKKKIITSYKKNHSKTQLHVKGFFWEKGRAILFQSNPFGS
jgi:hypothetical protein